MTERGNRFIDRTGHRYGRLRVLSEAGRLNTQVAWLCRCDCDAEIVVRSGCLAKGSSTSCGCKRNHGGSTSPEHQAWRDMKQRCSNPNLRNYKNYGGRGIMVGI